MKSFHCKPLAIDLPDLDYTPKGIIAKSNNNLFQNIFPACFVLGKLAGCAGFGFCCCFHSVDLTNGFIMLLLFWKGMIVQYKSACLSL